LFYSLPPSSSQVYHTITDLVEIHRVVAITEDENSVGLRDANSSRERPKLEGFDMDADVV
jgi:hypothetical protein